MIYEYTYMMWSLYNDQETPKNYNAKVVYITVSSTWSLNIFYFNLSLQVEKYDTK